MDRSPGYEADVFAGLGESRPHTQWQSTRKASASTERIKKYTCAVMGISASDVVLNTT